MKLFEIYENDHVDTVVVVIGKRAERRKKTAHAKNRDKRIYKERESRRYPYSAVLGKGKRHDHHWIDEPSIVEVRYIAKVKSEFKDFTM